MTRFWAVQDEVGGWFHSFHEVKEFPGLVFPVMVDQNMRLLMCADLVREVFKFLHRHRYTGWKAVYIGRS